MDLQPNKTDAIYLPITNTRISASEWNQLVGSCMAFITEAGLTPDASDNEQFLNAFKVIAASLELVGANTNLSNLTATGEGHFANPILSNVTAVGTSTGAGWAMPSDTYEDLTPGASGTIYSAPSNGIFCLEFVHPNDDNWINYGVDVLDANGNSIFNIQGTRALNNQTDGVIVPVRKGQKLQVFYNSYTINRFRFIYAEGSKSEAN